jgi:signal transduction histidine kinase/ActR/RegA family two-component response regulator
MANLKEIALFFNDLDFPILALHENCHDILFMNRAFVDFTQYPETKKIPDISEVLTDTSYFTFQHFVAAIDPKVSEQVRVTELWFKSFSGEQIPIELKGQLREVNGERFFVFSVHDMRQLSELKKEVEAIGEEAKRVSKLADIGRLSAGIAHELNNPLAIIQGYADAIDFQAEKNPVDPTAIKKNVGMILKSVDRMAKIIKKMTSMAREGVVELKLVTAEEVVQEVLHMSRATLKQMGVNAVLESEGEHVINCDSSRIEQILVNMLSNASYALENREKDRQIKVKIYEEGTSVCISVTNNGAPIPVDQRDKLFTPFFTSKKVNEGTGLGLFLSFGIMKAHEGDLSLSESDEEKTTFVLRFPKPAISNISIQGSNAKVLLVDDEAFFRQILAKKIEGFGFKVIQARNGEEAIETLKNQADIQVVFTDLRMDLMGGQDLIAKAHSLKSDLKFVVVTGFNTYTVDDFNQDGAQVLQILRKPIVQRDLESLMALLQGSPAPAKQAG